MNRLAWAVVVVVGLALLVAEAAMQPTGRDRVVLYAIFAVTALVTVAVFMAASRVLTRARSLRTAIGAAGLGSVAVAAVAVVLAAQTMFLSSHDRNLVLVALGLGVGLGAALAVSVAGSIGADLARIRRAAEQVAEGILDARTGVERVDELGDVARAFDRMVDRLAASEQERRLFLAYVGHDLRTPLASLQAALEALEDGVATDTDSYLQGMALDLEHVSRLVEDLFLLARVEAGRLDLDRQPVDLGELADEAVEALQPLAARAEVRLGVETAERVDAGVDAAAMGRVLRNLVENAIRHTPAGGTVSIAVWNEDGRPRLRVADSGPGFPVGVRETAFESFTRGDGSRSSDGSSGLGLAIARGIVEAHGGHIRIEDGPGGRILVEV